MAAASNFIYCLIFCASISNSIDRNHAIISKPKHSDHAALYVFGDSLFDSGNNQYINNGSMKGVEDYLPYGETFFHHATGRRSDGRLVPDFIAIFAGLPMPPPYLQPGAHNFTGGCNFASGGSGVLPTTGQGSVGYKKSMHLPFPDRSMETSKLFQGHGEAAKAKMGEMQIKTLMGESVFLFSSGGNDLHSCYMSNPNASHSLKYEFVRTLSGNITKILQEIYDMGGRKFAFQDVAPLGCLPGTLQQTGGTCDEKASALAHLHNKVLRNSLAEKLANRLPGFKYSIFDYYHVLKDMILYPSKCDFKNGKEPCCNGTDGQSSCGIGKYELCKDPSEYVWFDGGHTTESANKILADLIWNGAPSTVAPCNVKQLFEAPSF